MAGKLFLTVIGAAFFTALFGEVLGLSEIIPTRIADPMVTWGGIGTLAGLGLRGLWALWGPRSTTND